MADELFPLSNNPKKIRDHKFKDSTQDKTVDTFIEESDTTRETFIRIIRSKSISIGFSFIFLLILLIIGRMFFLQVIHGNEYRAQAEDNRIRIQSITAARGAIMDRNGEILAQNIASFSIMVTPADLSRDENTLNYHLQQISDSLEVEKIELEATIENLVSWSYQPVILKDDISYEQAMKLMTLTTEMAGIDVIAEARREYPQANSFSHILGYTGRINETEQETIDPQEYQLTDWLGKTGIEKYYETDLKGVNGKKQVEVNSLGKAQEIVAIDEAISGNNLYLSIDLELQKIVYEELSNAISNTQAVAGSVIALDPRNGEIIASVSLPDYNNNSFIQGFSQDEFDQVFNDENNPLFNRTISGEYPSGSTIKPVIASAALEEGIVNQYTSFMSTGGIKISNWFFPDWRSGGHGSTNVIKAISDSVNTYFYIIGGGTEEKSYEDGLGVDKINEYATLFNYNKTLGIDIPGEADGFLPTPEWKLETKGERWYIGDTYHLAIGQGDLLATPLQIASSYMVFANSGTLYQPHYLLKSENPESGEIEEKIPTVINDNIVSSSTINIIRQGLRETVLSGSAKSFQSLPVSSAAKTGTAQFGNEDKSHAWFATFAPYENPEIVLVAFLEEGGEGSSYALPVAKNILNWYFSK